MNAPERLVDTGTTSKWIPRRRIAVARSIALGSIGGGIVGGLFWRPAAVLVIPGLVAAWITFVMTRVRSQLSADGGGWERRIHELVASKLVLSDASEFSVLDIGCGEAGLIAVLLARSPSLRVTGVDLWGPNWDYSQAACEARVASLGRRAEFRRMNAARLEFPDAAFDAVVSVMCFHEVRADGKASLSGPHAAVREALRVLKPGGRFVLVDRFADRHAYGRPEDLDAALHDANDLGREPLSAELDLPWPLDGRQSLGPVELITGTKSTGR